MAIVVLLLLSNLLFAESELKFLEIESKNEVFTLDSVDDFVIDDYVMQTSEPILKNYRKQNKEASGPIEPAVEKSIKKPVIKPAVAPIVKVTPKQQIKSTKILEDNIRTIQSAKKNAPKLTRPKLPKHKKKFIKKRNVNASVIIKAEDWQLGKGVGELVRSFEIRPNWSDFERWADYSTGEVNFSTNITNSNATISSTFISMGHMLVNFDTQLKSGLYGQNAHEMFIPAISSDEFNAFALQYVEQLNGGHLLIDLDSKTDSVDIDASQYGAKLLLNEKLKVVDADADYYYILYLNLRPGNHTITYHKSGKVNFYKVAHIVDNEITYDLNEYQEDDSRLYSFYSGKLMGQRKKKYQLSLADIELFSSSHKIRKVGSNIVKVLKSDRIPAARDYFEFNQNGNIVYVGTGDVDQIEVPDNNYLDQILYMMDLTDLRNVCLVQLNLPERSSLKELKSIGRYSEEYINQEIYFLNDNGDITKEYGPTTRKVFLLGDRTGVFTTKLKYHNGEYHFLDTFCKQGSYLIEQL